jgi:hypothetical protein
MIKDSQRIPTFTRTDKITPVLIAAMLSKESAEDILEKLSANFPNAKFSMILSAKSRTWRVHATPVFGYSFNPEAIKEHCLKHLQK